MGIVVRPADLSKDRDLIIGILHRYLTPSSDYARFDWLYKDNPYGLARTWIATDTDTQVVIGVASAFPRWMYVGGREELGWVLGDFCVSDHYRSLGPALQLQRTCLAEVGTRAAGFCYDFPSLGMMAIYKRLGISPVGHLLRLTRILRVDRKVKEIVKVAMVARGLSLVGNLLLKLQNHQLKDNGVMTVSLQHGDCGEEFSALARQIGDRYGACVQRTAGYLNWRYLHNPLAFYEILTARVQGALVAYAVFTQTGEDGLVTDLFGTSDPTVMRSLISNIVMLLQRRGAIAVNITLIESHPWVKTLQSIGFRARETKPIVLYTPTSATHSNTVAETNWLLMQGDRDS